MQSDQSPNSISPLENSPVVEYEFEQYNVAEVGAPKSRRHRRQLSARRKQEVAAVRKRGACAECRRRKIRCFHALAGIIMNEEPPPPPPPSMRTMPEKQKSKSHDRSSSEPPDSRRRLLNASAASSEMPFTEPYVSTHHLDDSFVTPSINTGQQTDGLEGVRDLGDLRGPEIHRNLPLQFHPNVTQEPSRMSFDDGQSTQFYSPPHISEPSFPTTMSSNQSYSIITPSIPSLDLISSEEVASNRDVTQQQPAILDLESLSRHIASVVAQELQRHGLVPQDSRESASIPTSRNPQMSFNFTPNLGNQSQTIIHHENLPFHETFRQAKRIRRASVDNFATQQSLFQACNSSRSFIIGQDLDYLNLDTVPSNNNTSFSHHPYTVGTQHATETSNFNQPQTQSTVNNIGSDYLESSEPGVQELNKDNTFTLGDTTGFDFSFPNDDGFDFNFGTQDTNFNRFGTTQSTSSLNNSQQLHAGSEFTFSDTFFASGRYPGDLR